MNRNAREGTGRCLECGNSFVALSVTQKYCSARCGKIYRQKHSNEELWPSVTFNCSQCGKQVTTEAGSKDMRSRFCCASCEKKFWRHPPWENPSTRINFRSAKEYASYERRTNGE